MSKVAKAAAGLMLATLFSKVLGFGRELALASSYGASGFSDAFLVSLNIPTVIFSVIGTSLGTAFIPLYSEIYNSKGSKEALNFTNNVLNVVVSICIVFSMLGVIFAESLVKIFAFGFEPEVFRIATLYTRIMLLGLGCLGMNYMMSAYLQVKENFVIPGLMAIPYNIILIATIIISAKINPDFLAVGALIGLCSQLLFQLPFAMKHGYKYKFIYNLKDEYLKKMMWLVVPVLAGVAVTQVNAIIDKSLASTLVEGSISALNYGNRLVQFVLGLFIVSISTVVYPLLSVLSTEKDRTKFNNTIATTINTVILLVIPVSIGAIALAKPIVKLLFERGAFSQNATEMTVAALICYAIGIIGFGLRDILGKVFYSLQDTKTPVKNGALCMMLNICLNITFITVFDFGHAGLALATSISSILCIILLLINLYKKIGDFGIKNILKTLIKVLVLSMLMSVVVIFTHNSLATILGSGFISQAIALLISVLAGITTYSVGVYLVKIDEVNTITEKIKEKLKK